jgi:hypothetical protein
MFSARPSGQRIDEFTGPTRPNVQMASMNEPENDGAGCSRGPRRGAIAARRWLATRAVSDSEQAGRRREEPGKYTALKIQKKS